MSLLGTLIWIIVVFALVQLFVLNIHTAHKYSVKVFLYSDGKPDNQIRLLEPDGYKNERRGFQNKLELDGYENDTKDFQNKLKETWKTNATEFWDMVDSMINNNSLYPKDFNVSIITDVLRTAKAELFDLFADRNSLKWMITLEGGQSVLFKPSTAEKHSRHKLCNHGCEHAENEVAGFTINRMLGLNNYPFAVGRNFSWSMEVLPLATQGLIDTMMITNGSLCVNETRCFQYDKEPFCYQGGVIPGVMVYFIREKIRGIVESDGRDYNMYYPKPDWEEEPKKFMLNLPGDDSFCKKFRRRKLYRPEYMYRHVLDSAIISYITNHRDQKMFVKQTVPTIYLPIMFDFGFAFCNPENYNLILAAPIYQCCHIRRNTYEHLMELKDSFISKFEEMTRADPLHPLLARDQLEDVQKRINMLLSLVHYCVFLKGRDSVIRDSFPVPVNGYSYEF